MNETRINQPNNYEFPIAPQQNMPMTPILKPSNLLSRPTDGRIEFGQQIESTPYSVMSAMSASQFQCHSKLKRLRANSADEFNLGILDKYDDENQSQEMDNSNLDRQNSQAYHLSPANMMRKKTQNEMIMPSFSNKYNFRRESMDHNEVEG